MMGVIASEAKQYLLFDALRLPRPLKKASQLQFRKSSVTE